MNTAAQANANTVVVLLCGSAVECPWADKVKAVLYMGLPGEAGGEAIANLLYGKVNPSGKLAESWPYTYEDVPSAAVYGCCLLFVHFAQKQRANFVQNYLLTFS